MQADKSPAPSGVLEGIRAAYGTMPVDYKSPAQSDGLEGIRAAYGTMQADRYRSLRRSDALERRRLENDANRYGYDISTPLFDKIKMTLQQWVSNVGVWFSNLDKAFDKSNIFIMSVLEVGLVLVLLPSPRADSLRHFTHGKSIGIR